MSTLKALGLSVTPQDIFTSAATQATDIGAIASTGDGRVFRYTLAGATTLVPGKLQQGPVQDTTNQNPSGGLAVAAAAIGATQVTLTGTLTLAANLLTGGFLSVNVTPGQGQTYKIKSNTAVSAAANCVVTLEDGIQVALTTSSKVVVTLNPYNGAIVCPTTLTGQPIGWPVYAIVNAQYGWLCTHGPVSMLSGASGTAVGGSLMPSAATAGSVITATAGNMIVGTCMNTFVTTEYDIGFALID